MWGFRFGLKECFGSVEMGQVRLPVEINNDILCLAAGFCSLSVMERAVHLQFGIGVDPGAVIIEQVEEGVGLDFHHEMVNGRVVSPLHGQNLQNGFSRRNGAPLDLKRQFFTRRKSPIGFTGTGAGSQKQQGGCAETGGHSTEKNWHGGLFPGSGHSRMVFGRADRIRHVETSLLKKDHGRDFGGSASYAINPIEPDRLTEAGAGCHVGCKNSVLITSNSSSPTAIPISINRGP